MLVRWLVDWLVGRSVTHLFFQRFQMRSRISIRGCVRPSVGPSVRPSVRRSVTHELKPYKSAVFDQNYYQYERGRILCRVYGLVLFFPSPFFLPLAPPLSTSLSHSFQMRSRISIRGYVRPSVRRSVRPSVGRSVRHTRVEIANLAYFKQSNGTRRYVT